MSSLSSALQTSLSLNVLPLTYCKIIIVRDWPKSTISRIIILTNHRKLKTASFCLHSCLSMRLILKGALKLKVKLSTVIHYVSRIGTILTHDCHGDLLGAHIVGSSYFVKSYVLIDQIKICYLLWLHLRGNSDQGTLFLEGLLLANNLIVPFLVRRKFGRQLSIALSLLGNGVYANAT